MRFPQLNAGRGYSVSVGRLAGGLNRAVPPERVDDDQLTDCQNVWYKDGFLQTRPGFRTESERVFSFAHPSGSSFYPLDRLTACSTKNGTVTVVQTPTEFLFLSADGTIEGRYTHSTAGGQGGLLVEETGDTMLCFMAYSGAVWRLTLSTHTAEKLSADAFYAPLVMVNGRPTAGLTDAPSMTTYEGFNLLTARFRMEWTTGEGTYYSLPVTLQLASVLSVSYRHADGTAYTFSLTVDTAANGVNYVYSDWQEIALDAADDAASHKVRMVFSTRYNRFYFEQENTSGNNAAVALPSAGFAGNLCVTATREGAAGSIGNPTFAEWYGGDGNGVFGGTRLFIGGMTGEQNLVRYSHRDNPLYFPENNFFYVGDAGQAVTAFGKQADALVIFKEREIYACTYSYTAVSGDEIADGTAVDVTAAASFPLYQLSPSVGCDLPHTVVRCGNRLVWATTEGRVYTISSMSNYTDRSIRALSYPVEPVLKAALTMAGETAARLGCDAKALISAARYDGYYLLQTADEILLFDCDGSGFAYVPSYADEKAAAKNIPWFRWVCPMGHTIRLFGNGNAAFALALCPLYEKHMTTVTIGGSGDRVLVSVESEPWNSEEEKAVSAQFTTKLHELNVPAALKTVTDVFLDVGRGGDIINITYLTERGRGVDVQMLIPPPDLTDGEAAGDMTVRRLTPHRVRVREFGTTIACDGVMRVAGWRADYRVLGEVRA